MARETSPSPSPGGAVGGVVLRLPDWLAYRAATSPDRLALVAGRWRWSFAELHGWADVAADRLRTLDLGPGEPVALLLQNGATFAAVVHAAPRADACTSCWLKLAPQTVMPASIPPAHTMATSSSQKAGWAAGPPR